ncbi:MAG: hypothetical protein OHK0029_26090 [Armatimonadaceae bacterium]
MQNLDIQGRNAPKLMRNDAAAAKMLTEAITHIGAFKKMSAIVAVDAKNLSTRIPMLCLGIFSKPCRAALNAVFAV